MLAVSIACGSHTRMINEREKLENDGVQLVELRLDLLRKEPNFGRLLSNREAKVIATIRRPEEGGFWKEDEEKRLRFLRTAIIEGVDYVDLEADIAQKVPRYGKTKRIVSFHNMRHTPDLKEIYDACMAGDPDIIKIAVMPDSIDDVFKMIDFLQEVNEEGRKVPTIGISMSEYGAVTRILANRLGCPFTYAAFSDSRDIAPGMFFYKTLRDLYRFDTIDQSTEIYGIVADPIEHSLSPLLHNKTFREQEKNKVYIPFRVSKGEVNKFVSLSRMLDLKGLSVTIPHKVDIIDSLTEMDPAVNEINACNTVVFNGSTISGHNTDYLAAILSINSALAGKMGTEVAADTAERLLSGKIDDTYDLPFSDKTALVLGAGGAGKALAYGLKALGAHVTITDGNEELAKETALQMNCACCPWTDRERVSVSILANCTPIGMYPHVDQSPVSKMMLSPGLVVFDAVYNPEMTWLIRMAKERGCIVVPGMEMFCGQAVLQYKYFTGEKAPFGFMYDIIKNALHNPK